MLSCFMNNVIHESSDDDGFLDIRLEPASIKLWLGAATPARIILSPLKCLENDVRACGRFKQKLAASLFLAHGSQPAQTTFGSGPIPGVAKNPGRTGEGHVRLDRHALGRTKRDQSPFDSVLNRLHLSKLVRQRHNSFPHCMLPSQCGAWMASGSRLCN